MSGHTKGPWGWFGNNHGFYLATPDRGRLIVMDFTRLGMRGGQPRFGRNHRMVNAADMVTFEVGDGAARGFAEGKADPTVYRYDINGIDHPNARLIAAAPELLEALEQCATDLMICADNVRDAAKTDHRWTGVADKLMHRVDAARAAIAKAKGETT